MSARSSHRAARGARRLAASVALALALSVGARPARAGDYHSGLTLLCSDCHVMHFSQSHGYDAGGFVGSQPLGPGPNPSLLRNRVNDMCLACHDNSLLATDVLGGVNSGSQTGIVRSAGYLSSLAFGVEAHTGHTLESLDNAPGSQPPWSAQSENGGGQGLTCINCHAPHGTVGSSHPTGSQFRNLRDDPGHLVDRWVTYNHQSPGTNVLSRDVFLRQALSYDESRLDWNEPDPDDSALARWCGGCHTSMHKNDLGNAGGSSYQSPLDDHPVWKEDLESDMITRYNGHANRVKVMSEIGLWFPVGGDATPSCMTCHRAHGNGNDRGLIFRSGTGTPTENGDTGGSTQADLCMQCHDSGNP